MNTEFEQLSGPDRLAMAYAHPKYRDFFGLLLCLDKRLADILQRTSEPLIAQMRIAWWNDVITKSPEERPAGEPLLELLNAIERNNPDFDFSMSLQQLTLAWELLMAEELWTTDILKQFAEQRSRAIFVSYAKCISATAREIDSVQTSGEIWAINELPHHLTTQAQADAVATVDCLRPVPARLPRTLRTLSILVKNVDPTLTNSSLAGFRLIWHAFTGR